MTTPEKEAPKGRDAEGNCPGWTCQTCYLKPKEGRCPFLKQKKFT